MQRVGIYQIPEVLSLVHRGSDKKFGVYRVRMFSKRYQVFKKSLICSYCGIIGRFFALERYGADSNPQRAHFNLYALNYNGHQVMMTKDHIIPRSLGGSDRLENLTTACYKCNTQKGNMSMIDFIFHKNSLFVQSGINAN